MKVKLLVSRAGVNDSWSAGDVIEVSAAEGKRMIEANQCIPYAEKVKPETRVAKPKAPKPKAVKPEAKPSLMERIKNVAKRKG